MDPKKSREEKPEDTLAEFVQNMMDGLKPEQNDTYFLRWLRSKNFDREKEQKMLAINLGTRGLLQFDNILEDYKAPEVLITHGFTTFLGFDKDGSPVRLLTYGRADMEGHFRTVSGIQFRLYWIHEFESDIRRLQEENKRTGRSVDRMLHLIDMEGFTLKQFLRKDVFECILDFVKCFRELYPRFSKGYIIFNAPIYFHLFLKLFKPIMKNEMIKNTKIISGDSWKDYLLTLVDAKVLPKMLGGTSDVALNLGGTIPDEKHAVNQPRIEETDIGVKSVAICPRVTFAFCKVVAKPNSTILLEFRSENSSLGFSVFYKRFDPRNDQITSLDDRQLSDMELKSFVKISVQCRLACHLVPERHNICCRLPGIYAFSFDNSRSLLWSNKLVYRAKILETQEP